jgi:hypothetical protein
MNNDLARIWKETAVALFKLLSRHLRRGTEEHHGESRLRNRSPCRDLNPDFPITKQECSRSATMQPST